MTTRRGGGKMDSSAEDRKFTPISNFTTTPGLLCKAFGKVILGNARSAITCGCYELHTAQIVTELE